MSEEQAQPPRAEHPEPPTEQADSHALWTAADDAVRLAEELLSLHRRLAPAAHESSTVRAARYRLEDAAYTCRRASEEFLLAGPPRAQTATGDHQHQRMSSAVNVRL